MSYTTTLVKKVTHARERIAETHWELYGLVMFLKIQNDEAEGLVELDKSLRPAGHDLFPIPENTGLGRVLSWGRQETRLPHGGGGLPHQP